MLSLIAEDPWHTPTLESPFTGGGGYRIDSAGNTHLRVVVTRNAAASGALVFTLPEMYRPAVGEDRLIVQVPTSGVSRVSISAAGEVRCYDVTGTATVWHIKFSYSAL